MKTGRPRKSAALRSATVSCRLTQDEFNYLNDRALNEGYASLNDLVRALLLADMPPEDESSSFRPL